MMCSACAKHLKLAAMADEQQTKLRLEIAHVLFIDIVGYSANLNDASLCDRLAWKGGQ